MRPIPYQTPEESGFIKEYLLLPLMLDLLERDLAMMGSASLKMPELYRALIHFLQKAATVDLSQVRKNMREHGMKVYEERRTSLGIEAHYLCRGYHYEFTMLWTLVKAEMMQRFYSYLGMDVTEEGMIL